MKTERICLVEVAAEEIIKEILQEEMEHENAESSN